MARGDRRRWGWWLLVGASAVLFLTTALWVLVAFFSHFRAPEAWGRIALAGGPALLFWWWIGMGALRRAQEPRSERLADPVDGPPPATGPWGYVGWVLTVLVLGGLAVVLVWSQVEDHRQDERRQELATEVRRELVRHPVSLLRAQEAVRESRGRPADLLSLSRLLRVRGTYVTFVGPAAIDQVTLCVSLASDPDVAARVTIAPGTNPEIVTAGRRCR